MRRCWTCGRCCPAERADLLDVLTDLTPTSGRPTTACPGWTVKDIAVHVLGEELGWLSRGRDGDTSGLLDDADRLTVEFVQLLDEKNQRWVDAASGLSPRVVIDLLRWSGDQFDRYVERIDLDGAQLGDLVRPGPDAAMVRPGPRLHRAVGAPAADPRRRRPDRGSTTTTPAPCCGRSSGPCPHHYREVAGAARGRPSRSGSPGPAEARGPWSGSSDAAWDLTEGEPDRRDAEVALTSDAAWRVLTGAAVPEDAIEFAARSTSPVPSAPPAPSSCDPPRSCPLSDVTRSLDGTGSTASGSDDREAERSGGLSLADVEREEHQRRASGTLGGAEMERVERAHAGGLGHQRGCLAGLRIQREQRQPVEVAFELTLRSRQVATRRAAGSGSAAPRRSCGSPVTVISA